MFMVYKDCNIIMVSGLPCSGKSTLSKDLAKIYRWKHHSNGDMLREEWRNSGDARPFEEWWAGFSREQNLQIEKNAREILQKGYFVADVKYHKTYEGLPGLKIFVSAAIEARVERAREKYNGKPVPEIRRLLEKREADEVAAGIDLYGYDFREGKYDLFLRSDELPIEEEIEIVTSYLPPR